MQGIEEINEATGTEYRVSWKVLNAADFGVPQIRERVFLIGSREGRDFVFPPATHADFESPALDGSILPRKTSWDALGDLEEPVLDTCLVVGGKWGDLLPSIPEGRNYLWHTNRGGGKRFFGWRTRYWSFLLKLDKGRPSWTIQAQPGTDVGPFHWNNRRLAAQEMCRLQTFPDGLVFECGRTEIQRMLGNAVPSLLAEVLTREVRSQLLDSPPPQDQPTLLPPVRRDVPPAATTAPVPKKYLSMIGDHLDLPGTKASSRTMNVKKRQGTLL